MITRRILCARVVALCALAAPTGLDAATPDCPWDCAGFPGIVSIDEFLAVIGTWGQSGVPCDYDGGGVGITDFLTVLGRWGPCPIPDNDDCDSAISLDRTDPDGSIVRPFEMFGATVSPETLECLGGSHTDIWFCLVNDSGVAKTADVSVDVPMAIEVTEGCSCPPGPVIAV